MENISAILEALIFSSESPITFEKVCAVLDGVDKTEVKEALAKLIAGYDERQNGICVQEVAGGFQYRTRSEMSAWVKKLKGTKPASLSPAALETLAIVAYRQPIVKSEIESIRGVDVGAPLKGLLDKKLIRIVGRKDVPGKPIIYGTTKKFLEVFNLKELADLPTMRELKELTENQEIFEQESAAADTADQEKAERESFTQEIFEQESAAAETATQETPERESSPQEITEQESAAAETATQETPERESSPQETAEQESAAADTNTQETLEQESSPQETTEQDSAADNTAGQETPEHGSSPQEISEDKDKLDS